MTLNRVTRCTSCARDVYKRLVLARATSEVLATAARRPVPVQTHLSAWGSCGLQRVSTSVTHRMTTREEAHLGMALRESDQADALMRGQGPGRIRSVACEKHKICEARNGACSDGVVAARVPRQEQTRRSPVSGPVRSARGPGRGEPQASRDRMKFTIRNKPLFVHLSAKQQRM